MTFGSAIDEVGFGASRREAAEQFGVSASAVIKWVRRWCDTGSATAKPSGGSVSPLEKYAQWFFDLIGVQPDLTLGVPIFLDGSPQSWWRCREESAP
jgi:transposase